MPPIKPFLEWEVKLARLLKKTASSFRLNIDFWKASVDYELPLIVADFRADTPGWTPHPDDLFGPPEGLTPPEGAGPSRSSWPVSTPDQSVAADAVIPDQALVSAWNNLWLPLSKIEKGGPSREQVAAEYSALYEQASAAADRLKVPLD